MKTIFSIILIGLSYIYSIYSKEIPELTKNKLNLITDKILKATNSDSTNWERMAYVCDTYGPRLAGSSNLNLAIKWFENEMIADGLENVHLEEVMVPNWKRGLGVCQMISPRFHNINVSALGGSIATPSNGITAPIIVVSDYNELHAKANEAKGKIVVYSIPFKSYGQTVSYRFIGAIEAAKVGALASITRPSGTNTMGNPHTGMMIYNDTVPKIPHGCISEEDAFLLERMYIRGQNPVLHLVLETQKYSDTLSYNVLGELKGSTNPNEIIAIGGHTDCWDLSSGAHDDAAGVIACMKAVKLIKDLGLKTKRTIRCVGWVNEENGVRGGKDYAQKHKDENHVLMFEFDSGVFAPSNLGFSGPDSIFNKLKEYEQFFQKIDSIKITKGGGGVDIDPLVKLKNVPAMSLNTHDQGRYFWYHHSFADVPEKVAPQDLNKCVATIALMIYIYGNIPIP